MIEFQVTLKEDRNLVSSKVIEVTQYEHRFTKICFECPRYLADVDISTMLIYVGYERQDRYMGETALEIKEVTEDKVYCVWTITKNVTFISGAVSFNITIKDIDEEGNEALYWSSFISKSLILVNKSIKGEELSEEYPDVITMLMEGLEGKITKPLVGEVGQILSVKSLDENGSPLEFEVIDMGSLENISDTEIDEICV